MKLTSYIVVGLTLASILASCGNNSKKGKDGRTDTYSSGTISFVSDESFSPIIEEEREVFQHDYPDAKVNPIYTNESDGINMLLHGKTWLVFAARDFKPAEQKSLEAQQYMPTSFSIAYDALAFIVNKNNTDTLLSVKEVRDIMNGKITKWSQLDKKSKKKTAEVIKYVEQNPNAIGIIGNNWLNDKRDTTNLTFKRNIRVMSLSKLYPATAANSRKPYQYYIYNGEYPLIRTVYALLNDPRQGHHKY